jgi:hypothetical protein
LPGVSYRIQLQGLPHPNSGCLEYFAPEPECSRQTSGEVEVSFSWVLFSVLIEFLKIVLKKFQGFKLIFKKQI